MSARMFRAEEAGLRCRPACFDRERRASTALNTLAFFGAFAGQYLLGAAIDLWPLTTDGRYQPDAFRAAFGGILVLEALGLSWYLISGGRHDPAARETG